MLVLCQHHPGNPGFLFPFPTILWANPSVGFHSTLMDRLLLYTLPSSRSRCSFGSSSCRGDRQLAHVCPSLVGTSFNSFEEMAGRNEEHFFSRLFGDSHSRWLLIPLLTSQTLSMTTTPTSGPCFSAPFRSFPQLARSQKFLTKDGPGSWLSLFSVSVYTVVTLPGVVLEGPLAWNSSHLYFSLNWNYGHVHNSRSLGISCSFPVKSTDLVDSGWRAPGKTECAPLFSS